MWEPPGWRAGWSACRCAGRSRTRAASIRGCGRRSRPRSTPPRRASTHRAVRTRRRRRGRSPPGCRRPPPRAPRPRVPRSVRRLSEKSLRLLLQLLLDLQLLAYGRARLLVRFADGSFLAGRSAHSAARQLRFDRGLDLLADLGHLDLGDQLTEEAAYDHPARLVVRDAARLQVEQVLVVEAAGRGRVPRAHHLAGEDLEVRHGVDPGAV